MGSFTEDCYLSFSLEKGVSNETEDIRIEREGRKMLREKVVDELPATCFACLMHVRSYLLNKEAVAII